MKENVIPDEAIIKLNVRSFDEGVRKRVLAAIERIVKAEAAASGAPRPPEITPLDRYPLVVNDPAASQRVADAFRRHFPAERVRETGPAPASEDFGSFGAEWHAPSVFWRVLATALSLAGVADGRRWSVRILGELGARRRASEEPRGGPSSARGGHYSATCARSAAIRAGA